MASVAAACAARVIAWIVWLPPETQLHGRFFDVSPQVSSTFLPRHAHHLGGHALAIGERFSAEIADAGLDVHPAVRLDDEEAVETDRAPLYELIATPLPRTFVPCRCPLRALRSSHLKSFRALVQRFFHEAAGRSTPDALRDWPGPNFALPSGALILRIST